MTRPGQSISRWGTDPVLRNGNPVVVTPRNTKDYVAYLAPFARHHFLNVRQIAKLAGRSFHTTQDAVHVLKSEPNFYLKVCNEQANNKRFYLNTCLYYDLTLKGEKELAAHGIPNIARATSRSFDHEVMVSEISSSLDIGASEHPDVEILWWNDLANHPQVPEATKKLKNPLAIPTQIAGKDTLIHPDYSPFVIRRKHLKAAEYIFLPGFEADADSESLETSTQGARTIRNHFEGYLYVMQKEIYRSHFGATSLFVPFVFTNQTRMHNAIDLLNRIPEARDYTRFFLFKWMPTFKFGTPAPATGHILLEPWTRGNGKSFSLVD
jgi:hypothetical protein